MVPLHHSGLSIGPASGWTAIVMPGHGALLALGKLKRPDSEAGQGLLTVQRFPPATIQGYPAAKGRGR